MNKKIHVTTYLFIESHTSFNLISSHYRVAKTHRMPYLYRSFSAKEPYNLWLFCEKGPAT